MRESHNFQRTFAPYLSLYNSSLWGSGGRGRGCRWSPSRAGWHSSPPKTPGPGSASPLAARNCSGVTRVRISNLGLCFSPFKCCVSQLSVDRFGKILEGLMTLSQVKSSPNLCSIGPLRAEKRAKNTNLNLNSGHWGVIRQVEAYFSLTSVWGVPTRGWWAARYCS